jgi:tripartite ATP-independent transporter DctP family solute receptor
MCLALLGCDGVIGGLQGNTQQTVIRISHSHQARDDSEIHVAASRVAEYVESRSDDIKVRVYANNSLGQEREVYEGMQLGAGAACSISGTAILANFNPRLGALDLPFLWRDYDHIHRALDGAVGDQLREELRKAGFEVLAWMDSWGRRNVVTTSKDVREPEELKGLKLRTIPAPSYILAMQTMGVNPTPMAFGEIYTSLENGVIDGFEHTPSTVLSNRFYEVTDYLIRTNHLFGPIVMVCSRDKWQQLSEPQRQLLLAAAKDAATFVRQQAPIKEQQAIAALQRQGMTVRELDTREFVGTAVGVHKLFAEKYHASDLIEAIGAVTPTSEVEI